MALIASIKKLHSEIQLFKILHLHNIKISQILL